MSWRSELKGNFAWPVEFSFVLWESLYIKVMGTITNSCKLIESGCSMLAAHLRLRPCHNREVCTVKCKIFIVADGLISVKFATA